MSRIKIVTGHFGSGKTEVAINLAMKSTGKTAIIDMDIVNPYFRTADAAKVLKDKGIDVILPQFANTNVDLPSLPSEILSVFANKEINAVFDVGGDDDGATALGRYNKYFTGEDYEMLFIINTSRPLTKSVDDIIEMMKMIEYASRLRITHLVNATHLSGETTEDIIIRGQKTVEEVMQETGVPIAFTAVRGDIAQSIAPKIENKVLGLDLYIKLPLGL